MIICCEQCSTRFKLDDARIPEEGIRVRCSRCRHAFFVKRPGASWEEENQEDPSDFFEHDVDQTLTGAADDALIEEAQAAQAVDQGSDSVPADESPFEDGDWEFNDDSPFGESTDEAKDTLGAGHDFDVEVGDGSDVFGDADLLAEDEDPVPVPEPRGDATEPEPRGDATEPEPRGDAAESDLGSPESWDIVGQDAPRSQPAAAPVSSPQPTSILRRPPVPRPPVNLGSVQAPLGRIGRAVHAAGWIAVLVLFATGLYASLWPQPRAGTSVASIGSMTSLEALHVEGRWLENAIAGPIYVISGEIANPGSSQVVPGARLVVRLLDDRGAAIAEESAALGPPLPRWQLREIHPRELRAIHADAALRLAWTPIPAGERRLFQAVLTDVPEAAGRFELDAIPIEEPAPIPEDLFTAGVSLQR